MWAVLEKKTVEKQLRRAPRDILLRYEAWKRIVEIEGPAGLRAIRGFRDETLKGDWRGFRSSRLGRKWRVIYAVVREHLEVYVVEVNPHDY